MSGFELKACLGCGIHGFGLEDLGFKVCGCARVQDTSEPKTKSDQLAGWRV